MSKTVVLASVVRQESITGMVKKLELSVPEIAREVQAGQFVHLRVADSFYPLLRRPFSIADADAAAGTITLIYRIVGQGTALLARLDCEDFVDCMGPLGTGFSIQGEKPLLVGGGMGLAPLVMLARTLCPRPVEVLMGGRNEQELFWPDIFNNVCQHTHITTDDGSIGRRGFTTDLLPELLTKVKYDIIYACGPQAMLSGVVKIAREFDIPCQVSLEEYMACGIGACLSCTCAVQGGKRRKVCTDGPVFWAGEVIW
ncbi:MAG TPA: dihydroorotate dehydrogenase electron transfer subunit [Methylomusa anaerophila]|uniref:Dihydroorotate dehydrogenase B (NAD(+)), electron transfer subunit n=1 Tax=Methylomusa anaerophila TaxID=1930071 RepID=A0A348AQN4_9FIRM|nr:dihydroorotate dehydrogenase electron transfer subunit [Methylomusa anaerophila]BBB93382.1 dihydroorotate dehydrogenase B (NAD(+)), electron transfer subunit [Methylomusa anaerophila]HML90330.1 dihydroorotate dehydrogenase electron transfer subunit [Methylomusa anaerophila]